MEERNIEVIIHRIKQGDFGPIDFIPALIKSGDITKPKLRACLYVGFTRIIEAKEILSILEKEYHLSYDWRDGLCKKLIKSMPALESNSVELYYKDAVKGLEALNEGKTVKVSTYTF